MHAPTSGPTRTQERWAVQHHVDRDIWARPERPVCSSSTWMKLTTAGVGDPPARIDIILLNDVHLGEGYPARRVRGGTRSLIQGGVRRGSAGGSQSPTGSVGVARLDASQLPNRYRDEVLGDRLLGSVARQRPARVSVAGRQRDAVSVLSRRRRVLPWPPGVGAGWRDRRWSVRRRRARPPRGCCTRRCGPGTPGVPPACG